MTERELKKELITNYLKNSADTWSKSYITALMDIDIETLRDDVDDIIITYCTDAQLVCAFDNYVTEYVECGVQIFRMAEDLEDVWFNICNDEFIYALNKLEENIKSGRFSTKDLYWEMDGEELRSFNHIGESVNWFDYGADFADEVILDKENFLNLPIEVRAKIDDLLCEKSIL